MTDKVPPKPPSPLPQTLKSEHIGLIRPRISREEERFELIKAALTGLLANPNINAYPEYLAQMAIRQADAALAEWEKNQT